MTRDILRNVLLVPLNREIVVFVFVLIHINESVFLIGKVTFLEKLCFLCNLAFAYHFVLQCLHFCRMLPGCKIFLSPLFLIGPSMFTITLPVFKLKFFRIFTIISEFFVMKSGLGFWLATSVSG